MKTITALAILTTAAKAHYTFPGLIYDGVTESDWSYVRQTSNFQSHGPVQDVTSKDLRCFELSPGTPAAETMAVKAGDKVGFRVDPYIGHPGPLAFYLARAPDSETAATFSGDGSVWFKIYEDHPAFNASGPVWPSEQLKDVSVTIPGCIADGYYLLRVEHIALHSAQSEGGAQFYMGCAQVHVTGGGSAKPAGVSLPGAYSATDPGILYNLYWPIPTSYVNPGPAPFTC